MWTRDLRVRIQYANFLAKAAPILHETEWEMRYTKYFQRGLEICGTGLYKWKNQGGYHVKMMRLYRELSSQTDP